MSRLKDLTEGSEWYGTVVEITHVTGSHENRTVCCRARSSGDERSEDAWPGRSAPINRHLVSYSITPGIRSVSSYSTHSGISRCNSVFDTLAWNKVDFRLHYTIQTSLFLLVRNENIPRPCAVQCPIDYLVSVFVLFANNLERSYLYVYCRVSNFLSSATKDLKRQFLNLIIWFQCSIDWRFAQI